MKPTLEDLIGRYSQAMDDSAAPIEDLIPPEMAEQLGFDRTDIEITTRLVPRSTRRRAPGWAIGIAVAVFVAVLAIPLILLTSSDPQPVAFTSPATGPVAPAEPSLEFDRSSGRLSGSNWDAGATVTATMGDAEQSAVVGSDGSFLTPGPGFAECCFETLVVTDGTTTIRLDGIPHVEVTRVDPQRDIVAGQSPDGPDVELRITGGAASFETSVTSRDGGWSLDLGETFDLQPGMVVQARVELPEITVTHQSSDRIEPGVRLSLGSNAIVGDGFAPRATVTATVDGVALQAAAGAQGEFSLSLGGSGLELAPGTSVSVSDGISTIDATAPLLTYDVFDPGSGLASGTTDFPDGTQLYLELWMTSDGSDEPNEYATFNTTVSGGAWLVDFDPIPGDWTVLTTDVGRAPEGGYGVEMLIEPR